MLKCPHANKIVGYLRSQTRQRHFDSSKAEISILRAAGQIRNATTFGQ